MIIWKPFKKDEDPSKIAELVGMKTDRESNPFLVMCKFTKISGLFEARFAKVNVWEGLPAKVNVDGMSGTITISHWSEVNYPDTATMVTMEDVKSLIKQLDKTSPNSKK